MNRTATAACLLAPVLFLAGCAAKPTNVTQQSRPIADCVHLDIEMASAADARRVAHEKQQSAWKAVIPFAVAGRYASAGQAAAAADKRLAELQATAQRMGCIGHVHS